MNHCLPAPKSWRNENVISKGGPVVSTLDDTRRNEDTVSILLLHEKTPTPVAYKLVKLIL